MIMVFTLTKTLTVKSPEFTDGELIPYKFTCDGENINPEITVENVPEGTMTLALIMEDPDAPKGTFDHWIMWNMPVTKTIHENSAPGMQGKNGRGENKYTGPCPPSGTHHYHFKVYALDMKLDISDNSDKHTLLNAMEGHILAQGELVGLYRRKN
jgi:hypothetical protein